MADILPTFPRLSRDLELSHGKVSCIQPEMYYSLGRRRFYDDSVVEGIIGERGVRGSEERLSPLEVHGVYPQDGQRRLAYPVPEGVRFQPGEIRVLQTLLLEYAVYHPPIVERRIVDAQSRLQIEQLRHGLDDRHGHGRVGIDQPQIDREREQGVVNVPADTGDVGHRQAVYETVRVSAGLLKRRRAFREDPEVFAPVFDEPVARISADYFFKSLFDQLRPIAAALVEEIELPENIEEIIAERELSEQHVRPEVLYRPFGKVAALFCEF